VGRRNLIPLVAVAAALAAAATATAAISWRTVGDGTATGPPLTEAKGYIATSRAAALAQFGSRLTAAAGANLRKLDFTRQVLVAVFGEYGCNDGNIVTSAIVRHGRTLTVELVPRPPAPGTVTCQALFPTYRFLALPRSALGSSLPTGVVVHVA
jgi:hypothetical protein